MSLDKIIFGARPDTKDKRDIWHHVRFVRSIGFLLGLLKIDKIDWRPYCMRVKNQGSEGVCTAFATIACREILYRKNTGKKINLSERFLYEVSKRLDSIPGEDYEGTQLRASCKAIHIHGVCLEKLWKYITNKKGRPMPTATNDAKKYRVKSYKNVRKNLVSVWTALQESPLMISVHIREKFEVDYAGVMHSEGKIKGYHAMLIIGYLPNHKQFIVRNSWGRSWGTNGNCYWEQNNLMENIENVWMLTV